MGVFLALEAPMLTAPGLHGAIPVRRATSAPKAWDDSSAAVWIGACRARSGVVPPGLMRGWWLWLCSPDTALR